MIKTLFIFGTRPEAIKLCPVLRHMRSCYGEFDVRVCITAQHRAMLDQVLNAFEVTPDYDLNVMQTAQTLSQSTSRMLAALEPVLDRERPDIVLVQGDTTTTFVAAIAAFYKKIHVGHVEAGLRTWDMQQPFPEEMNRVLTGRLSSLHFAPTSSAERNLLIEGVDPGHIHVTGNSGIDALLYVRDALLACRLQTERLSYLDSSKKLVVVTAHRRESFGEGLERICHALATLAQRDDVQIVYPVHRNPNVLNVVNRTLRGLRNVCLIEPLDYVSFVDLMNRAWLLLTDSGGIQEEGPSLGKPILVMREKTERPEAVNAGTIKLVGTDHERIVRETTVLLENEEEYRRRSHIYNPYGDGHASGRIGNAILDFFGKTGSTRSKVPQLTTLVGP